MSDMNIAQLILVLCGVLILVVVGVWNDTQYPDPGKAKKLTRWRWAWIIFALCAGPGIAHLYMIAFLG